MKPYDTRVQLLEPDDDDDPLPIIELIVEEWERKAWYRLDETDRAILYLSRLLRKLV